MTRITTIRHDFLPVVIFGSPPPHHSRLWLMESEQATPVDSIKGCSSKFCEGSWVWQTPEESLRTYWPKCCGNNNKDEDNSLKTLNNKNHQALSQKFRQLMICMLLFLLLPSITIMKIYTYKLTNTGKVWTNLPWSDNVTSLSNSCFLYWHWGDNWRVCNRKRQLFSLSRDSIFRTEK